MGFRHHQIVIVGGGSAGITVASTLFRKNNSLDIAIIEPSAKHYYQPGLTFVGAGIFNTKAIVRNEGDVVPANARWIKDAAVKLLPDQNKVVLKSGEKIQYHYLVLCPGIQINWHKIHGLKESLGKNGVCSNYSPDFAPYTYECIRNFRGGTAIFTQPNTPMKCGGAAQKAMYLASDYFRRKGLLNKAEVRFTTAAGEIFGIKIFADTLTKVVHRYGIKTCWHHNLKEIKYGTREAVFDLLEEGKPVSEVTMKYDMIHVTPPMSAPDFIKESPLANQAGWIDLDKDTLQHKRYMNVFGLGDASGTPNAKTCAAVRKQAPVVVENLLQYMNDGSIPNAIKYNGYGSCPIATGYGKLLLTEFDYDKKPTPTFPLDPSKERYSMWLLKKYFLPWFYWNRMLRGKP
ncbi:MAG: NAD(P)/FAD-dependent oxidoreductase [Candidatus Brocadia sp.]|nr:NAD(P)/FAD-dependent oxidoreductase [Candidatus Brocadia sp.]